MFDAGTVEQIRENPYLQYFLGFSEYRDSAPFDASMLVHFRQRLNLELQAQVNDAVVESVLARRITRHASEQSFIRYSDRGIEMKAEQEFYEVHGEVPVDDGI